MALYAPQNVAVGQHSVTQIQIKPCALRPYIASCRPSIGPMHLRTRVRLSNSQKDGAGVGVGIVDKTPIPSEHASAQNQQPTNQPELSTTIQNSDTESKTSSTSNTEQPPNSPATPEQYDPETRKQLWKAAIKLPMYSVGFIPVLVGALIHSLAAVRLSNPRRMHCMLASWEPCIKHVAS